MKLVDDFTKKVEYITNEGRTFYFLTNHTAPKYKVRSSTHTAQSVTTRSSA